MYGQIPSDDLTLTITSWNTYDANGLIKYIRVEVWYNWENIPYNRLQDNIALSWDKEFRPVDNSFKKVDYYHVDYGLDPFNDSGLFIQSQEKNPASVYDRGIEWYADLFGAPGYAACDELFGYGTVKLEPYNPSESGNIQLRVMYVHNFLFSSASINIGSYGSISVSGSNFDQISTYKTHYWDFFIKNYYNNYYTATKTMERLSSKNSDIPFTETDGVFKVTDSVEFAHKYDVVDISKYYNISLDEMKNQGYKYISMYITLEMWEENMGYQEILIYSDEVESKDYLIDGVNNLECGGASLQTDPIDMTVTIKNMDINKFDVFDNRFIVRYGAHGNEDDNWYNQNLRIKLVFSKNYYSNYHTTAETMERLSSKNSDIPFTETDGVFKVTDSVEFAHKYDVVDISKYYNISLDEMKNQGYKYISMYITLEMWEENMGYQEILIYSDEVESKDYLIDGVNNLECGGTSLQTDPIDMTVTIKNMDINKFDVFNNRFIVRYGAHGNGDDNWYNQNMRIKLIFSKTLTEFS